jgi:hypothetical protein
LEDYGKGILDTHKGVVIIQRPKKALDINKIKSKLDKIYVFPFRAMVIDAPPNFLIDSNASPRVKTMKE